MKIDALRIDPEFQRLLPVQTPAEDAELEQELADSGGARDPIVVWRGHDTILDGHRRYAICERNHLPYATVEIDLPDRIAAKAWMIRNQLSRRNVGARAASSLRAHLLEVLQRQQVAHPAEQVAAETGVTDRTVYRDQALAKALDKMPRDLRGRLEQGGNLAKTPKAAIMELAAMDESEQRGAVALADSGQYPSLSAAVLGMRPEEVPDETDALSADNEPPAVVGLDAKFLNADRQLGLLRRLLDELGNAAPGPHYAKTMALSAKLCDVLAAWRKDALCV